MLQRHIFSHGFTPPLVALLIAVLIVNFLHTGVLAEQQRCHQLGSVRQGVTLTVKDSKAKHLLGPAKSLKDCIALSCKTSDANYAVLEDGKCHALHCKKNTCQISEDVKSKQKIVGLSRGSKAKSKHAKKVISKKNQSKAKPLSRSTEANTPTAKTSNWTLAFSTVVVPSNKTNPLLTSDSESHFKVEKKHKSILSTKSTAKVSKSTRKSPSKLKQTVIKTKVQQKLHRKHSKRRAGSNKKDAETRFHKEIVNSTSRRLTRDYPYQYYQYQYPPSDKSYTTQETDWRRDTVPSADQSYAGYDSIDRQPLFTTQDDLASVNQVSLREGDADSQGNGIFSLPIASLVRRTEIPEGTHHISAVSIVNDMLPASRAQNPYLTDRDTIPLLSSSDDRQSTGYIASNNGDVQDSSDRTKLYSLTGLPSQYQVSKQGQAFAADLSKQYTSSDGLPQANLAMFPVGQSDSGLTNYKNYVSNATGIPLGQYAPLAPLAAGSTEDQSPTMSPVVIGSDQSNVSPLSPNNAQSLSGNPNNATATSSMEMDLTDPGHAPNSPEAFKANMKKLANISALANVLPSKEVASVADLSPNLSSSASYQPPTIVTVPGNAASSISLSATTSEEVKSPGSSLYAALSAEQINPASSSSKNPQATIFPSTSTVEQTSSVKDDYSTNSKVQINDIDAPVQNAILPFGGKKDTFTEPQSGDGQLTTGWNFTQRGMQGTGVNMDLPFPTRLKLPEPSQSLAQALSGLSMAVSSRPIAEVPLIEPTVLPAIPVFTSASSTKQLTEVPYFTTRLESAVTPTPTERSDTATSTTNYEATENPISVHNVDITGYTSSWSKLSIATVNSEILSNVPTAFAKTTLPTETEKPTTPPTITQKPSNIKNNTVTVPQSGTNLQRNHTTSTDEDAVSYTETVLADKNQTYEITSDSNIEPTDRIMTKNKTADQQILTSALTTRNQTIQSTAVGHISPGSRIPPTDQTGHLSPISKPKLKLSDNGNVIVLNNSTHTTERPGIQKIYEQYRLDAKRKNKLKKQRRKVFKKGNGCNEPLGLSNGLVRDYQLTSSSYLSPEYAPAKGRLGMQQGGANGWCADPRLNNVTQYLQVDFQKVQEVCRVGMQGHQNLRNWISHYKVSFSMDGRHWSIYKEGGKDKVIQGNIAQEDWTSYRLILPIRTRFIRILPQTWEGNAICTRVEFYTQNQQGGEVLYGRSSIPNAMQNLIDDLSFEKIDNEIVFDSSPMGNNAYLNKGAAVYDTHGKCRHAARIIEGSDILLDGRNMRVKPREAISISVWIRMDNTEGVHSIFDTIGANSRHVLGQYHFEIVGGAVRWFHRDENGTQIFSAITEPNFVSPREWNHLVASYDSQTGETKIYVNGSRVADTKGSGLLSQDWGGRVGLGRHKDTRDLQGDIDEFRIYNEAIQGEKILELSRECNFDKYYCGSVLTAERGMLITPDYPSLHHGPVECLWEIKGMPGEIVAIDVKEFDINNCNASRLEIRDRDNDTLIGSYCGGAKPGRIESHGNQMTVKFISTGSREGERFKIEFQREKKRTSKKTMSSLCRNSDLYQNVTLVGGSKAGTFTDLGHTNDMRACQERCCDKETCEIAFMIEGSCYGVRCYDQNLCKIRKAKNTKLNPMLSFITRVGITPRIVPMFAEKPKVSAPVAALKAPSNAINVQTISKEVKKPDLQPAKPKRKCLRGEAHHNVTMARGMKAGNFTSRGVVDNFDTCFDKCCEDIHCDAAFMVKRTCFSIRCNNADSCKFKAARPSAFNPTLAYVIKDQPKPKVETTGTAKSAVIESNSCTKSRVSKIYQNVTLRDGINSGEFIDRGSVGTMDDCVKQCCGDDNCNLAFIIKETCFTVKCKSYESCSLKAAVSHFYNPKIAYVNWNPPRDNLGEGKNKYDYKGCWRDFDMSAFAIPLLEGTDPLLTGIYKKRDDPVNDCATVSQHRGYSVFAIQNGGACFSGPKAASSYKRYGPSESCKGGRGGAFSNSVYKLFDDGSVMSLGCWADLQDRAFKRMEKLDAALQEPYQNRAAPIDVCATVAKKHSASIFALQKGGQCFIGKGSPDTYRRYGPSRKCKYGLGGQMANDVYIVRGDNANTANVQTQTTNAVMKNRTGTEEGDGQPTPQSPLTTQPQTTTTPPPTTTKATTSTTVTTTASSAPLTTTTAPVVETTTPAAITTTISANTESMPETTVQATAASNANIKSADTSTSVNEQLQPGEVVYKEQLTDTEHIKFVYSADAVVPNVTLAAGINSGTFIDKGTIENMDDCVKSCGQTNNCDIAFKLGKQCFGITCKGPDSCRTKPAFSAFYNPQIAKVKHRTIKTPRRKEEIQTDSNPTQRSLCKAKNTVNNVTLVDGIGAGNFTDLGHITDMDDCISRCCSDSKCELAFRIEDDCYGVTCYSEHSCRTRSARNAISLRPIIAFVRDVGSRQVLMQENRANSGEKKSSKSSSNKGATCSSEVWEGERLENMTLVGGVSAGEFTDHGQTDTFDECMGYCCGSKDCDLAFMIDNDCYGVRCKDPSMCKTRPARPTKYRPIIAFKKSSATGIGVAVQPVVPIVKTMFKDRTTIQDNIDDTTFAVRAYYSPLTTNSPNSLTTATTTAKTTMTVIPRPPGTTPGFSSTLVKSKSSATPTFGDPSKKHSCEAGSITYNATLKMGMHSGLFTKLGHVNKMDDCIERCCRSSNADVAFMLGSVCFAVKCYSPELCKVAPAMISNIGNLNMNPTLSFLKKKETAMTVGNDNNDIDVIIDEITDKGDEQNANKLASSANSSLLTNLANISTAWEVHDRIRPNPPRPAAKEESKEVCKDSPITYNVTLKGGIHAGNFTNQGEGLTARECIGKCCEKKSCDLAFMFADLCYSVECKNEQDCQAVVAKPSRLDPKISFVSRNRLPYDVGTMFDVSTTVNEDEKDICDEAKLSKSPIMNNKTLAGGLKAGNFTYLGRTRDMKQCLGKCCSSRKCDVAYRIDNDCFSVKCFSPDLCKVADTPAKNGFVQIATLTPVDRHKLNTRSIAVYVMLGCVIFTVVISGIGMALCGWLKSKRMKSQHQQTDATPMPDR
ncbi:uncharacterized protein LOC135684164 isoform X2 [Rhopilema esculentum]|uniref:uncharacterized protein LOC135684164 isoform X2 n=1 Tax=Rhopilema esculentum TaxID=499914 RepID=UPI0031D2E34E